MEIETVTFNVNNEYIVKFVDSATLITVPETMENTHRVLISEWEAIEGNTITPYEE